MARLFFLIVIACLAIGFALLYFLPSKDVVVERYAAYSDAVRLDAFDHGMIPDFLPKSATNIVSHRNLDLNNLEVVFDYSGDEFVNFMSHQKKSPGEEAGQLRRYAADAVETADLSVLIIIPKVMSPDSDSQGALIINTKQKRAIYFLR